MAFVTAISFGTVFTTVFVAFASGFVLGAYVAHKAHKHSEKQRAA